MRKILFLIAIIFILGLRADSEEIESPLSLTIKTDKQSYTSGEEIKIFYCLENKTDKPQGFFRGYFSSEALDLDGKPLKGHLYCYQSAVGGLGDYIILKPNEKFEEEESFGNIVYDEIKDYKVVIIGKRAAVNSIVYEGLMLDQGFVQLFLSNLTGGKLTISAKYCTDDPNPCNFTKDDCDKVKKEGFEADFSLESIVSSDPLEFDRHLYCQEYEKRTQDAWVGCFNAKNIEVQISENSVEKGSIKEHYADGTLRTERQYKNNKLHGATKYYYPSATLQRGRNYVDGKLERQAKDYFENGNLQYFAHFKNGKYHGMSQWFDDSGQIVAEANFVNGELHGRVFEVFKWLGYNGNFKWLEYYGNFRNGKFHGVQKYDYQDGENEDRETHYVEGELDGLDKVYHKNGKLKSESKYKRNKLVYTKEYDPMGNLVFDKEYICPNGKKGASLKFSGLPFSARVFVDKIMIHEDGVIILMKNDFRRRYQNVPIYLNKQFKENKLFIPRDANLSLYRSEEIYEHPKRRMYAFIAAYPLEDKEKPDLTYQFLYFYGVKDDTAVFLTSENEINSQELSLGNIIAVRGGYESIQKCE